MTRNQEQVRQRQRRPHDTAVLVVLAMSGLCASFMFTLVVPVQSELPRLLDASRADTAWIVTATLLTAAVSAPVAGRLGDMYGKRRVVLALLVVLVLGSTLAALTPTLAGIIVGRALQGFVTGVIPLGISILRDVFPPSRVDTAIAVMSATLGVGGSVGLPISAFVSQHFHWQNLFWVSAGMGCVGFVFVRWIVPESPLRTGGRFDFAGGIGLIAGLGGILLAISRGNDWGWLSVPTLGFGLGGVLVLLVWGWHEMRVRDPLLPLRVTARPAVLLTNIASAAFGFALFTSNILYPQMLALPESVGGFGLSLIAASVIVMPSGLVTMFLAPLSGYLARTVGPRPLLVLGAIPLVLAYGFSLVANTSVWHILVPNILIGIGVGLGFAAMPMLIMRSVDQSETGVSNGVNSLFRSIGTSSAAAAIGAVLAGQAGAAGGAAMPSESSFIIAIALGIGGAILALVLALLIPVHKRESDGDAQAA